jgi:phosphoglycolate phosphatase
MADVAVIFDLDGTLVDTAPDLIATLNVIFERIGLRPVVYEHARNLVGGGARKMIERGLAAENRVLESEKLDALVGDFIDHYATHIADRSRPFEGVEATLTELAGRGCVLAVCTNKLEWLARRLLDALGLSRHFVAICGADTFQLQKPDPEFLHRTISLAGCQSSGAIMVGDSISDVAMAKAAGVVMVTVAYGYTELPITTLGADRIITSFAELPKTILELRSGITHDCTN